MINVDTNDLQKLYIAYFGRPGDPSGINYWLSRSNESITLREISNELSRQDEYTKYVAHEKSLEFKINKIYLNLFNRKADFDGLNYWIDMVNNKDYQISDIVYNLLYVKNKPYSIDINQEEKDINIIQNKTSASEIFTKQISKSITLINLYKPDSITPWLSGKSFIRVSNFLANITHEKVSYENVKDFISSLSDDSLNILTKSAIEIKGVSLSIPIYYLENRSLTKRVAKKVINITGGALDQSKNRTNIIALNNINLKIMKGERVALIGHNGSGKSSFLRLISGIYLPTSGKIKILVDVYPMLQKTFLTSSELSGIDACKAHYLLKNHTLKGFETFLNEIIEFSGLGSYISLPIKTYSEGMSARLIFSILTSSPHDCLAIDEGFGTGDADFCDRAEERMKQFMESAATLFLASHSEELLKQFCNRGIVFSHGSIAYDGPLDAALNYYHTHDYYRKNVIG
ncbi:ATP-binding cassette domain-containing protein [Prochlorococcus marinus]|uniref:Sugar ABC transporter ATP-binding protein n=1 Tax=Prochlorococcus marinus XMU1408 TaxID=2213228 RepID=A0A318R2A4_PROMR|nr:ATP-binding cassette domain-containing protein [Prochlorococcus marinus]MBW3042868.1 sugar ABC transporter ATP-binding protein [Prochlorococcus marinus str. XMU1408]PYE00694.1 sugar ABC transporter ATP-binding protein [Prochlorococcus marinus XMU1408]